MSRSWDVAVLGGGLAGNVLARHLRRRFPELGVAVFEKRADTDFKVGESTVEIFASYMLRRLGLSTYLYEEQLPKNGLRFFFDTPGRDAPLARMSEIGSRGLPHLPSFQLDRARFERDLRTRNRDAGVELFEGARVTELQPGRGGDAHAFVAVADGGARSAHRCRWLVDASGRARLLAKQQRLHVPRRDHALSATWARFRDVRDVDDLGIEGFAERVRHTSRRLSTVHFCYPGYWIWFIPLRGGVTSVGVVAESARWRRALHGPGGFVAFLRGHQAVRELLDGARLVDHGSYGQLAYGTRRFFSADRWALIGEAAAFTDPFYSPGSDFIALENDFLVELIARDAAGEDIGDDVERFERYMQFRFDANLGLYRELYGLLGSMELFGAKWQLDMTSYYHLWVDAYLRDRHLDRAHVDHELAQSPAVLGVLERFAAFFRRAEVALEASGDYHRGNLGRFEDALHFLDDVHEIGSDRSPAATRLRVLAGLEQARRRVHDVLGTASAGEAPRDFGAFASGAALE